MRKASLGLRNDLKRGVGRARVRGGWCSWRANGGLSHHRIAAARECRDVHDPSPRPWGGIYLCAFAQRLGDGVGGRVYAELRLQVQEPVPNRALAQAELPRYVRLFLDRGGGTQDLGLARGQAEAVERVLAEARNLLLEQQRVRIASEQTEREAPPVSHADERRARRQA